MTSEPSNELKTERFNMFMTPSEMEAIDQWSWKNKVRSKSEAVRRLCQIGLEYSGGGELALKRSERSLKALHVAAERLKTNKDKLPKGVFAAVVLAIQEQTEAYKSLMKVDITASSMKAKRFDQTTENLIEQSKIFIELLEDRTGREP